MAVYTPLPLLRVTSRTLSRGKKMKWRGMWEKKLSVLSLPLQLRNSGMSKSFSGRIRQTGLGLETRLERAASSERHGLPGACSAAGITD